MNQKQVKNMLDGINQELSSKVTARALKDELRALENSQKRLDEDGKPRELQAHEITQYQQQRKAIFKKYKKKIFPGDDDNDINEEEILQGYKPMKLQNQAQNRFDDMADLITENKVKIDQAMMKVHDEMKKCAAACKECELVCRNMEQKKLIETNQAQKLEETVKTQQRSIDIMYEELTKNLANHEKYCIEKNLAIDQKTSETHNKVVDIDFWRRNTTAQKFREMDEFLVSFGENYKELVKDKDFMMLDKIGSEKFEEHQQLMETKFAALADEMLG